MKRERIILMLVLLFTASLGFSQSDNGSGNTDKGSISNAGSTAGANATINNNSVGKSNFIESFAGVAGSPGPIPGFAGENGPCFPFKSPLDPVYSMKVLHSRAKNAKFDKHNMDWTVGSDEVIPENDDPIAVVEYNPKSMINPGDKLLGSGIIPGKHLRTEEGLLAVALLEAKKRTHTRRVAIVNCTENENVTKGKSFGFGISSSDVPGGGNNAEAASLGFSSGTNRVRKESHPVMYILAMNDNGGILSPPVIQRPPETPKAEIQPPPAPTPQTIRIEVVGAQLAPQPTPAPPPAPTMAQPTPPLATDCTLPEFVVIFDFNKSIIKDGYPGKIKTLATWLENHAACMVQVEGHASNEASFNYNAGLGRRRAKAVYDLLQSECDADTQKRVLQFVSLSKDRNATDYQPENRRVILRIIGSASGK
jgi:outer membrane protein OmpA-like peptidoglycan-associated protein